MLRNKNIVNDNKKTRFSKENQPNEKSIRKAAKKRSATCKKKRDLKALLFANLRGEAGKEIRKSISEQFGEKPETILEALHFMQIVKAVSEQDTPAYRALLDAAGLMAPVKNDITGNLRTEMIWNETKTYEADKKANSGS